MTADEKYMLRCLELAASGLGMVQPNPMVGCVIVHNGRIIGEGWHRQFGGPHAEVNAVQSVADKSLLCESTLYVNLEPCAHQGKTPPCADMIASLKIPKLVAGTRDPHEKVAGKGFGLLRKAGVNIVEGVMEGSCRWLNRRFFSFHEKKRPFVILKWAQAKDGFVDIIRDENHPVRPTWITDHSARMLVHKWRSEEQAILVGTKTAQHDNPSLNVRDWKGKNPLRMVIDRRLVLSQDLSLFDGTVPTVVFTEIPAKNKENIKYVVVDFSQLNEEIISFLYDQNIQSVIIEGGPVLQQSFINAGLWDEARVFTGRMLFEHGIPAPAINGKLYSEEMLPGGRLQIFTRESSVFFENP
ncbi:MAG: bifunctional diaminohydroxyphosphoribosylaminopyrimidine deaminase/5-amino-6-(5-phosphoribosylamino)uracil reductase RibD [Bacteroidota bacterium]